MPMSTGWHNPVHPWNVFNLTSQVLNFIHNMTHSMHTVFIKQKQQNDAVGSVLKVWRQYMFDPIMHDIFIHSCPFLTTVFGTIIERQKHPCNTTFWLPFKDYNRGRKVSDAITVSATTINSSTARFCQCLFLCHAKINWRLVHVENKSLVSYNSRHPWDHAHNKI